ncbi:NAD-dependent epimerase/dehydratase family protein [Corynebacterium riegelii]|uniref:NAD-dependent epimerase/dehydratase family protein n=1 Tax=Corynebacterium riegelii TaxID=156976 RepID=UPI0023EFAB04|nr:NAD(P)-dependent oxidoreductase [Corynebacterium riegelii]
MTAIVITGATGSLARDIIPPLREAGFKVKGVDVRGVNDPLFDPMCGGIEVAELDVADTAGLANEFAGADAVIHLAGIPLEYDWEDICRANVDGTQSVLEAAREAGVPRVVLASSIHAVGGHSVPVDPRLLAAPGTGQASGWNPVPADVEPFPMTNYGVSKAALEALGKMYAYRFNLEVVAVRIASRFAEPSDERMLSTWLSPRDAAELFNRAVTAELPKKYLQIWGVSHNLRSYLSLSEGYAIGYEPQDDAEIYAEKLFPEGRLPDRKSWDFTLGGVFSSPHPPRFSPENSEIQKGEPNDGDE